MTTETEATTETKTTTRKRGVGAVIREALLAGKDNEACLAAAKAEFPDSNTGLSTVSWYRSDMRKNGEKVKSARELKPAKAPAETAPAADAAAVDPLA